MVISIDAAEKGITNECNVCFVVKYYFRNLALDTRILLTTLLKYRNQNCSFSFGFQFV